MSESTVTEWPLTELPAATPPARDDCAVDRRARQARLVAVALAVAFAVLYVKTAFPGPGGRINYGDSIKWHYLAKIDGTPHPTGYPQFLILLHLLQHLPVTPDWMRVTLISILPGAAAIGLVAYAGWRLGGSLAGSTLAAACLGVGYTYWTQATEAEVYALNAFWLALVVVLFLRYHRTRRDRDLVLACLAYSLSFGNHLTMVMCVPALVFLVLATDPTVFRRPLTLAAVACTILLGASQYAYIYWLGHHAGPVQFPQVGRQEYFLQEGPGKDPTVGAVVQYVTGWQFHNTMWQFGPLRLMRERLPMLMADACRNLTPIGMMLVPVGLIALVRRPDRPGQSNRSNRSIRRVGGLFVGLLLAGQAIYAAEYDIADIAVYFIPIWLLSAILAAGAFADPRLWRVKAGAVALSIVLLCYLNNTSAEKGKPDVGQIHVKNHAINQAKAMAAKVPPNSALLVDPWGMTFGPPHYGAGYQDYCAREVCHYLNVTGAAHGCYLSKDVKDLSTAEHFYVPEARWAEVSGDSDYRIRPVRGRRGFYIATFRPAGAAGGTAAAGSPATTRPSGGLVPMRDSFFHVDGQLEGVEPAGGSVPALMGGVEFVFGTWNAWVGPREPGQLQLAATSDRERPATFAVTVKQFGVALAQPRTCPIELWLNDRRVGETTVTSAGELRFPVTLAAGMNRFALRIPTDAGPARYGPEPRPAMLYVTDVRLLPYQPTTALGATTGAAGSVTDPERVRLTLH